jgi:hypothetical protein
LSAIGADLPAAAEHITKVIATEILRQDAPLMYLRDGSAPPSPHHRGTVFNVDSNDRNQDMSSESADAGGGLKTAPSRRQLPTCRPRANPFQV